MATFGGGTSVSAAVAANMSSTGTLYSCGLGKYAMVQISFVGGSAGTAIVTCGGEPVAEGGGGGFSCVYSVFVGPGQSVAVSANSGGASVSVSGVEFSNI